MQAAKLIKMAEKSTEPFAASLSALVLRQIKIAFVGQWLADQDASIRAAAAETACAAIDAINQAA